MNINSSSWHPNDGLVYDVMKTDPSGAFVKIGTKHIKSAARPMSKWLMRPDTEKGAVKEVRPPMNGWGVYAGEPHLDRWVQGSLAYIKSPGNDVQNSKLCCLTSGPNQEGHGWSVLPDNLAQTLFIAGCRWLPQDTWLSHQDCFNTPTDATMAAPAFQQFMLDTQIFAMFNAKNLTSSLANVSYKGQVYDIPNHLFWLPKHELMHLHDCPQPVYNDARRSEERYGSGYLAEVLPRARADVRVMVAHMSNTLRSSLPLRPLAYPKYQLGRWDAGLKQVIDGLFKHLPLPVPAKHKATHEAACAEYQKFEAARTALKLRLRPLLYEFGILPKAISYTGEAL